LLSTSDTDIASTLERFGRHQVEVCLLVPTKTGLDKSIMDATISVRRYLKEAGCHDYDCQDQGQDHKVLINAFFVTETGLITTKASLYRPGTKKGDPRIWFRGLKGYAEARNLLAIFHEGGNLYIVNCSRTSILDSLDNTRLTNLAQSPDKSKNTILVELLDELRNIASQGFITTKTSGDTGVGRTLEDLLGIEANSDRRPDYKGIEIKASRRRPGRQNRVNLFSQVPNWKLSPIKKAWNLLKTYGYLREGRLQLYHTMKSETPNSIGLLLEVDFSMDWLKQNHHDEERTTHVATWEMEKLRGRLREKHPQTLWVKAASRGAGAVEEFNYTEAIYTYGPFVSQFDTLLESGVITLDYTLSQRNNRVRDHGYLFKINPCDIGALFPPPVTYDLQTSCN